jgi:oligopeptide/dipeptide ABC transporter ATP-binding protein
VTGPGPSPGTALLELRDLSVQYEASGRRSPVRAVQGVSLTVAPRETVGLVGESGSGKSTIGRAVLGLVPVSSGRVLFDGVDITRARSKDRRQLSSALQVVFQDPYSSLNPTRTIGQTLRETMRYPKRRRNAASLDERVTSMLERVGLPADAGSRYPGHFSGGQRQRIAIARALMAQPRLVVCDEPVSALDVSVQAQVLNLLHTLQDEFGLSYLFTAHDLAVVRHLSHRIVVLYRGQVLEQGPAAVIYAHPAHPYTQMLLQSAPIPDPGLQKLRRANRRALGPHRGGISSSEGCPFAPRCPYAIEICWSSRPELQAAGDGAVAACHRLHEVNAVTIHAGP